MLFILNKSHEVVGSLNSNGDLSRITTYFDDAYVQDLGTGAETFTFSTVADTEQAQHLVAGNLIAFKEDGEFKLFSIIQIEETHEDTFIKTVYCEMAGIELINEIIRPMKVLNSSLRKFLTTILEGTEWQLGKLDAGFTQVYDFEVTDYKSVYELIQEYAVRIYGAEISYRVEIAHGRIVGKYIDCYRERGKAEGFRFAYGSNLTSVTKTVDMSNLATALIGVGKNGITFKEVDTPDKPLNSDFIANETAYKQWNINGSHIFGVHKEDTDSPQELLRLTRLALEERSNPQIKYEMKVELLGREVKIGDTVNIVDHEFNPPLYLSARVNQLTRSKTDPHNDEVVLANFKELNSNITAEMRALASQLEGYVDSQFPIGGDKIQNGAIGKEQFSKQYHTEIVADAVYASLVETEELIAGKADIGDLNAINATIENLKAENVEITGNLNATNATIENLKAENVEINGSLTAQSASIKDLYANKISVSELNAVNAQIGSLKAENVEITGNLNATNATIESLKANKADIDSLNALEIKVNTINADKANISDLNAINAQIDSLKANKADIVELNATNATISSLNALVAEINTLVGGNLTMDNIQSLILSTNKVTVEDAFIKNAMIDTIDAGKISAGSIDTGSVTIESKDGGIQIVGNTQQFRDKNGVVRIQIGRDKNNNFTFSLFDETGKGVLIDHTGIKEGALADNIINSDMISEDAVGEKQINYNSFVTGFNKDENANVLKATKIMLDNQNQSLEVGFNTLKTQADDTKSKTDSNSTKLQVQQGQIQGLISDTIIEKDGESIKIKDAYSEMKQTVDGFGVTMGEHSTKITEIDGKANNALNKATHAEQTADGISGRVTEVESTQSSLRQDLDGFKTSVSKDYSTKAELKATNDKLGTIEGTVKSQGSKIAEIETSTDGIKQKVESVESTTTTLTSKVNTVEGTANTAKSTADSAKTTATQAQSTANSANTNASNALSKAETATTEITKTNQKVSSIETNLNGISSKVTNLESTTKTLDGKVSSHETRLKSAEQKITSDAIINTVSSTIDKKVNDGIGNIKIGTRNYIKGGKGDLKTGFFKNFNVVENNYGEHTLTSQKTHSNVNIADGFVLGCRDYEVGEQVTMSYEIMYTAWNFPSGTNRAEFWLGQRYTNSSTSTDGQWRAVTQHTLPVVGENGCELNKWFKVEKTMTIPAQAHSSIGTASSIQFYNSNENVSASVTFRIRNVKLEYGNKATDFSIAPEDINDAITEVQDDLSQNIADSIGSATKDIMNDVAENYTGKDEFKTLSESVTSSLKQTSKDITASFTSAKEYTDVVDGKLQKFQETVGTHIRFSENGIDLGKTNSPFTAVLDNTKLAFKQDGNEVAYISNNKMHITHAEIKDTLRIGKANSSSNAKDGGFFTWVQGTKGNLSLKWSEN